MELIMSAQEDATPWPTTTTTTTASLSTTSNPSPPPSGANANANTNTNPPLTLLLGRGYFSRLGIVRRKPSRGDAPPTASKSCSDKLALKQCTSLLSSLTSLFVSPAGVYLSTLVLPESQFSAVACRRCFSAAGGDDDDDDPAGGGGGDGDGDGGGLLEKGDGCGRMRPVAGKVWDASTGYQFVPFLVETTSMEFEFSRRAVVGRAGGMDGRMVKVAASNLAVAWTRDGEVEEGLVAGVLQGRKAFDLKGASLTSRRRMWETGVEVARTLGDDVIRQHLAQGMYNEVKEGPLLAARRKVKEDVRAEALSGWLRNTGDEEFSL
jgi:tRNA-specific adenosine deaminase 1